MKTQNNQNGGLNNKRPIPATLRGTERTELPPPPPPAKRLGRPQPSPAITPKSERQQPMPSPVPAPKKRLGQERRERDMQFWLNLTPEVRAKYMGHALTCYGVRADKSALRKAVELAKMAEMPSVSDF